MDYIVISKLESKGYDKNEYITGVYAVGRYAWILKDINILDKPIKAKGHLGIWNFE